MRHQSYHFGDFSAEVLARLEAVLLAPEQARHSRQGQAYLGLAEEGNDASSTFYTTRERALRSEQSIVIDAYQGQQPQGQQPQQRLPSPPQPQPIPLPYRPNFDGIPEEDLNTTGFYNKRRAIVVSDDEAASWPSLPTAATYREQYPQKDGQQVHFSHSNINISNNLPPTWPPLATAAYYPHYGQARLNGLPSEYDLGTTAYNTPAFRSETASIAGLIPSGSTSPSPSNQSSITLPVKGSDPSDVSLQQGTTEWQRGKGFWRAFTGICIPILLSAFEGSVVSTALPTISRKLGMGPNSSWVATAFLLASIICQPLYGQLADLLGRRRLMMFAVVIFGVGSAIACGANSGPTLIFGRVVQGLGSGGIDLFAELILCDIIPLKGRGNYVAIKASVYALGTTVGPVLGGYFSERMSWRWCFGINIPVCVVALVMMYFWLQVSSGPTSMKGQDLADGAVSWQTKVSRIDFLGLGILTLSVIFILYGLTCGGASDPWTAPVVLTTLSVGLAGVVAFAFWERSWWCASPIMAPHVFSNRTTVAAFIITMIHGFMTYGYQFYLPPFFQAVLDCSPTQSGVLSLPCTLSIVVFAAVGGPLLAKFGRYKLMHFFGFGMMAVGFGLSVIWSSGGTIPGWIAFSFFVGIGSGLIVSTTLPAVLVELTDKENAAATGSWAFLRGLGSLLGVAIPNSAFNAVFSTHLASLPKEAASQLDAGQAYEQASSVFVAQYGVGVKNAFADSLKAPWVIFLVLAGVGILVTCMERQVELRVDIDSDFGLKQKEKRRKSMKEKKLDDELV